MPNETDEDIRHGLHRYRRFKCRCGVCLMAYAEYRAKLRKHEPSPLIDATPLIEFILGRNERMEGNLYHSLERWRVNGIDVHTADRVCVRRGLHPAVVFGDAWYAIPFIEQLPEEE